MQKWVRAVLIVLIILIVFYLAREIMALGLLTKIIQDIENQMKFVPLDPGSHASASHMTSGGLPPPPEAVVTLQNATGRDLWVTEQVGGQKMLQNGQTTPVGIIVALAINGCKMGDLDINFLNLKLKYSRVHVTVTSDGSGTLTMNTLGFDAAGRQAYHSSKKLSCST